jgi:hypothetical protein
MAYMMAQFVRLFRGRLNFRTYLFGLFIFLCWGVVSIEPVWLLLHGFQPSLVADLLGYFYISIGFIFYFSITVRRSHDRGDSFTNDYELLREGEKKKNKYGKPPPDKIDFKGLFGF